MPYHLLTEAASLRSSAPWPQCTLSNNLFYSAFKAHWLPASSSQDQRTQAVVTSSHVVIAQTHWRHFPAVLQLLFLSHYVLPEPLTPLNLLARLHRNALLQILQLNTSNTHLKWFFCFCIWNAFVYMQCFCPCWPLHNSQNILYCLLKVNPYMILNKSYSIHICSSPEISSY